MCSRLERSGVLGQHVWLVLDGPLPFERRSTRGIGRAWYLFAGDQSLLKESMETSGRFVLDVLDRAVLQYPVDPARVSLLGFSQGGYLASVIAGRNHSRFKAAACIGGRLKHEFFQPASGAVPDFLQIHGSADASVSPELAKKAADATREQGFRVEVHIEEGTGHDMTPTMVQRFVEWERGL